MPVSTVKSNDEDDGGTKLSEHDYTRWKSGDGEVDELDAGEGQDQAAEAVD